MKMESRLETVVGIDSQLKLLQQLIEITEKLKKKCMQLEKDKNEAIKMCEEYKEKLERLNSQKCTNCPILTYELRRVRQEKENLKKEEKAKLLKTIAKTLENIDDGNTNPGMLTELVCAKLNANSEPKLLSKISLIENTDSSDEKNSKIFVNETVIVEINDEVPFASKKRPIVIPETEVLESYPQMVVKDGKSPKSISRSSKGNVISTENEDNVEQPTKKLRLSPVLSSQNGSPSRNEQVMESPRSPSVLSEIMEAANRSGMSCQNDKGSTWKMKPNALIDTASTSAPNGKKLKQMTLSVARQEKKHDISLSGNFKGGMARNGDDDVDVILPSPEHYIRKTLAKKTKLPETLEDPDMTVFNPQVTSTCLPAPCNTSFDMLPDAQNSPKYKYRRDAVRKRVERLKLPGQDCDECAKYYEAAGVDQSMDVRARLDKCSRHRDKYQMRANTPPGFWDPVLPASP